MNIRAIVLFATLALSCSSASDETETLKDGQVRKITDGVIEAWDAENEQWLSPEAFWDRYAARRGGLTWGRRITFPPYEQVKELDTLIIKLKSGPCLMEFFHTRWRRANDVRRWDTLFNEFGSCPHVFD